MKTEKRMFLTFLLNFIFTLIEFVGGIITNSVALISDSIHDLGDSISIGIAILLEKKSKKKPDEYYTYGYRRFSLLGALISSLILIVGSTFVIIEAVKRIINPELINSELLIYFAIFGVIINGLAALNISKGKSINEKVISLHLLEDVFGWVALLIGAIIMYFTDIIILDTLLSLGFTLYILYHVFQNVKKIFIVLLEKAPSGYNISDIETKLKSINNVIDIHHFHLWSLDGTIPLVTLHCVIAKNLNTEQITTLQNEVKHQLEEFCIKHITIQTEFQDSECINGDCDGNIGPDSSHHHHHHH